MKDIMQNITKNMAKEFDLLLTKALERKGVFVDLNDVKTIESLKDRVKIFINANEPNIENYTLDGEVFLIVDKTIDLQDIRTISSEYKYTFKYKFV